MNKCKLLWFAFAAMVFLPIIKIKAKKAKSLLQQNHNS